MIWDWIHKLEDYIVVIFTAIVGWGVFRAKGRRQKEDDAKTQLHNRLEKIEERQDNHERRQSDHGRAIGIMSERDKSIQAELTDVKLENREAFKRLTTNQADRDAHVNLSLDRILDIITKSKG